MDISHLINTITPITLFNKGKASQLFAKAKDGDPLVVVKNNTPIAVVLSVEEYQLLYELEHICEEVTRNGRIDNSEMSTIVDRIKAKHQMREY